MIDATPKVIYGDGTNEVAATEQSVLLSDAHGIVALSRGAFREVVLGWQRLLAQEEEDEG